MDRKRIMASLAACVLMLSAMVPQTAFADGAEPVVVQLESGADRSSEIVSSNDSITIDGKELKVIATGLKDENKAAFLKAVEDNFSLEDDKPVKIIDNAFVDAEKASVTNYFNDSALCWAASASNLLWLTEWAGRYKAPGTDLVFDSEDSVFDFYSENFVNQGSFISNAIDWFFMGTYVNEETGGISFPINASNPDFGLDKSFVSTLALEKYDLTVEPSAIAQIERTDRNSDSPVVFQGSIGGIYGDEVTVSGHSIIIDGIIIDPSAEALEDRYKGVIIIDSDNDGDSDEFDDYEEYPFEVRKASREKRPNSYTVYDLELIELQGGRKCWEIVNYSSDEEIRFIFYDITAFPLYDESIIEKNTETEGTKKHYENPDLFISQAFTTSTDEALIAPFTETIAELKKTSFKQGEAVNINVFIGNKGTVSLDESYAEGNSVNVDWSVKSCASGEIVASGRQTVTGDILGGVTVGSLIKLNEKDGEIVSWDSGEYEVTAVVNPDRRITESYYLNNTEYTMRFTIEEGEEQQDDSSSEDVSDADSSASSEEISDSSTDDGASSSEASSSANSESKAVSTAATENPHTGSQAGAAAIVVLAAAVVVTKKRNK